MKRTPVGFIQIPPIPNQGDNIMSNAQNSTLAKLVGNAEAGGYTLPAELIDAWQTVERVRALDLGVPDSLAADVAAAQVVAAVTSGKTPDMLEVGREMHRLESDRQAQGHASRALAEARELAAAAAVSVAVDMTERLISDHLRPALEDVYAKAKESAPALMGFEKRPPYAAPAKAAKAYDDLDRLAGRRSVIFGARSWVNFIGSRQPQHDPEGMFVEFEHPELLTPWWNSQGVVRWPGLREVAPEDPAVRLAWVVSDAVAPARPWLPTVAEQDEQWWSMFGEKLEKFARSRRDAESVGARGSF